MSPCGRTRGDRLVAQHRGLLDGKERARTELFASDRGVLDRHKIGVRAERAVGSTWFGPAA